MIKLRIYVREALFPDGRLPEQQQEVPVSPLGIIGEVDEVTDFRAIPRWNSVGSWTLTLPGDSPQARWFTSGRGIVVFKDGVADPIFSGPIRKVEKSWDAEDGVVEHTVTVSGVDDNILLAERLAWPAPFEDIRNQSLSRYWQTDLSWSNVGVLLKNLLQQNTNGLEDRWVSKLYIHREDPDLLDDDTARSTLLAWNRVSAEIPKMANVFGFRINCVWYPNPDLIADAPYSDSGPGILVRIEPVHDLTSQVQFGPHLGNLQSYRYVVEAPSATRAVMGAQLRRETELEIVPTYDQSDNVNGYTEISKEVQGPERYFTYRKNTELDPDWWGDEEATPADMRWTLPFAERGLTAAEVEWGVTAEEFVDLSSVDWQWAQDPTGPEGQQLEPPVWSKQYRAMLSEEQKFHAEKGPKADIQFTVAGTPGAPEIFRDFWTGDSVRLYIDDEVRDEVVREAEIIIDSEDGHLIKPKVGSETASNTPYLYRQIKAIWDALTDSNLEPVTSEDVDVPEPSFGFARVEEE